MRLSHIFTLDVAAVRHRFEHRLAEWHLAATMFLCGLTLLSPGMTFDLEPYYVIRQVASQEVWGWALILTGGLRLLVLAVNGALPRGSPHLRAGFAFIAAPMWSVLLAGFWTYHVPLLVTSFLVAAVVTEMVNAYRAAQDARAEDDKCGGGNATRASG
jgi:hypothetical protein